MSKLMTAALGLGLASMLAGCGGSGLHRVRPDEFAVARQAPLVIPPDYSLVPPKPGAARPQDSNPNALTLQALFGGTAPKSAGEAATLNAAGTDSAEAGIRSTVGDGKTTVVDKGTATRDIIAAPEGDGQSATTNIPSN
ncbi:DUF3035 domain-containing protein [Sphingomonas sp. GlSt437]|uniref:DUF3035 domain-containing protein n=1 Tax=Sphingomonas sp. GlSt437 TaxID=3389970 RepID=UPI003A84E131